MKVSKAVVLIKVRYWHSSLGIMLCLCSQSPLEFFNLSPFSASLRALITVLGTIQIFSNCWLVLSLIYLISFLEIFSSHMQLEISSTPRYSLLLLFSHYVVSTFCDPWTAIHQAPLSFTISWSLLKLMCIELVMPSKHLIFCHPFLLLTSVFSSIRVFSNE